MSVFKLLLKKMKTFQASARIKSCSEDAKKIAEKNFLKYALIGCKTPLQQNFAETGRGNRSINSRN
jgi:hypothetical protein